MESIVAEKLFPILGVFLLNKDANAGTLSFFQWLVGTFKGLLVIHVNVIKLQIWSPERFRLKQDLATDRINTDVFFSLRYQFFLLFGRAGIRLLILRSRIHEHVARCPRNSLPEVSRLGCDAHVGCHCSCWRLLLALTPKGSMAICHNLPVCGRYKLSRRKQIVEEYFDTVSGEEDGLPATTLHQSSQSPSSARIRRNPSVNCRYSVGG